MRYFVGCLLEQEPAWYYDAITADLARNFDIENVSEKNPPHITIVPPFEAAEIPDIDIELKKISDLYRRIPMLVSDFGRFGDLKTIFIDVHFDEEDTGKVEDIIASLEKSVIRSVRASRPFEPHVSIARHLDHAQSGRVWQYLCGLPKPHFETLFSNLTLFRLEQHEWVIDRVYELRSEM